MAPTACVGLSFGVYYDILANFCKQKFSLVFIDMPKLYSK